MRHTWRLLAGCAALFFGLVLLQQVSLLGMLLFGVCLAAALYSENWLFDTRNESVRCFIGIAGIGRRVSRSLGDLQDVRLLSIAGPASGGATHETPQELAQRTGNTRLADILSRRMVRLAVFFSDGESLTIQADSIRRYAQLQELGEQLADCTGVRFREIEL